MVAPKPISTKGEDILGNGLRVALLAVLVVSLAASVSAQVGNGMIPMSDSGFGTIPYYWVNIDVENRTGMWVNDLHIIVKEARIVQWYTGFWNPWGEGRVVRVMNIAGMNMMEIEWGGRDAVMIPPDGETYHFGYLIQGSWGMDNPDDVYSAWWTRNGRRVGSALPLPCIRYEDIGWVITVFVANNTGLGEVYVTQLEYTVVSGPVDLNELYWDNQFLEWQPLGEAQKIEGNQEVVVGAVEASGEKYVIVRMICTETGNPENRVRILFQRRADPPKEETEQSTGYQTILYATVLLALLSILYAVYRRKSRQE